MWRRKDIMKKFHIKCIFIILVYLCINWRVVKDMAS